MASSSLVPQSGRKVGKGTNYVEGIDGVVRVMAWFETTALVVTHMTSKLVAHSIFNESQWHVPYDTSELYDSGYWGEAGLALSGSISTGIEFEAGVPSIPQKEGVDSIIATVNKDAIFRGSGRGGVPPRPYVKYAVGYTAEHAVVVHENPRGQVWNQDAWAKRKAQGNKKDHFLKDAYDNHRDVFSKAMHAGIAATIAMAGQQAEPPQMQTAATVKPPQTQAGLAVPGAPRLVRR